MPPEQGLGRVMMFGDQGAGYGRGADVLHRLDVMGTGDDWTTTHRYEPFASNAAKARQFLREATTGIPLDQELVVLAGSELVTNAIRHAQTPFTVDVSIRADRLRIRVTDTSSRLPVVRPINLDAAGGLGLNIVATLAEVWGTYPFPGGKTVWFETAIKF
jgi:Histidine kinase-like ATPase domain